MSTITLKNAYLLDPSQGISEKGSIVVENGMITDVLKGKNADSGKVVDVEGKHLTAGFVDINACIGEPGFEQKESVRSGTQAAAAGGFTTVCSMPNTSPVNDSGFVTQYLMEKIRKNAVVRVHPIGAVSLKCEGQAMAGIDSMIKAGCVALSDGKTVMNAYLLRKTLEYLKAYDIPILEHCEDVNLLGLGVMNEGLVSSQIGLRGIPHAAEDVIVSRDISLSLHTKSPLHLSALSSKNSIEALAHSKARGLLVSAAVSPQHLLLTDESLRDYDTAFKVSPPLRTESDRLALVDALKSGIIDCISTQHTPHSEEDKDVEFEHALSGVSSLETAFAACFKLVEKKEISLDRIIEALTSAPAKIFKFKDRGQLKKGFKADFAVLDLKSPWTVEPQKFYSKSKYTPYNGQKFSARVFATYVAGEEVFSLERGMRTSGKVP